MPSQDIGDTHDWFSCEKKHYELLVVECIIYHLIGYPSPLNNSDPVVISVGLYSLFFSVGMAAAIHFYSWAIRPDWGDFIPLLSFASPNDSTNSSIVVSLDFDSLDVLSPGFRPSIGGPVCFVAISVILDVCSFLAAEEGRVSGGV